MLGSPNISTQVTPEIAAKKQAGEHLLRTSLIGASLTLIVCVALTFLIRETPHVIGLFTGLAKFLSARQDVPIAAAMILFFIFVIRHHDLPGARPIPPLRPTRALALLLTIAVVAWGLRIFILFDFDLSRDEQMVAFDSAIYARGLIFAPFPPEWRDWYNALNTTFILPVGDREGWVSSYLPGNAAFHALLDQIGLEALASPLLLLLAGLALWRIARNLWPDSPGTQTAVLLLFAGSSQAILMGTTRHAMTAHLAANLVWVWLFLQNRRCTHGAAIVLGFLATGLHQPLFHPLFIAPFLDLLWRERRWGLLLTYLVSYLAIGLFWLNWPSWVSGHGLLPVPPELQTEGVSYFARLRSSATALSSVSFGLMGANLLRFFTWQHVLVMPLMILGAGTAFRAQPVCRALALGMVLLVVAMLMLLPAQGHGWGYRYLHGFIGSTVLIAGFGWHRLEIGGFVPARLLQWTTALSLLVLLPIHAWMARTIIAPYAQASAALQRTRADIIVIDDWSTPFAPDLVRNRADLRNRPIMLAAWALPPETLGRLCAGGRSLAFPDARPFAAINQLFGNPVHRPPSRFRQPLQDAVARAGCRVIPLAQTTANAAAIRGHLDASLHDIAEGE